MNITQKHIFMMCPKFNKNLMLFGESIFQFATICVFFWFDLLPYVGTSKNLDEFNQNFEYGYTCFFKSINIFGESGNHLNNLCDYSMLMGMGFAFSYYGVYYWNSHLIDHVSPSFNSIVQIISTPLQMVCWFIFTPYLSWACANSHTSYQIIMGLMSLPFIVYGSWLFYHEQSTRIVQYKIVGNNNV